MQLLTVIREYAVVEKEGNAPRWRGNLHRGDTNLVRI